MANATLFLKGRNAADSLEVIARCVFDALGIELWEERFSSNYPPDEHYFAGYAENVELTIYDDEHETKSGYPFHLAIKEATWRKGPRPLESDANKTAEILAQAGVSVFIPIGAWYNKNWDGQGDVYAV